MYYEGNRTLTYNCLFNFIVGNRGAGKTYWSKEWAIKDFKKNGKQFIYVRRYSTEFKKIGTFWDDIRNKYPEDLLEVKGKNFYINKKLAGFGIVLSTSKIEKSTSYPDVNKIIYDEFIIEKGVYHYLQDEVNTFLNLYDTVDRDRDEVIAFFLSNAVTMTNPYFLFFDLKMPYNKEIYRKGDILLQLVADKELIEKKKSTRFGKIIAGTKYANYSINNEFLLDNDIFVEHKSDKAKYYFTIKFKSNLYGVWVDYSAGKIFVSDDVDNFCKMVYSLTLDDHSPNTLLIKRLANSTVFKTFIDNYKMGNVYFENIRIKNIVYDIIKMSLS